MLHIKSKISPIGAYELLSIPSNYVTARCHNHLARWRRYMHYLTNSTMFIYLAQGPPTHSQVRLKKTSLISYLTNRVVIFINT